MFLCAKKAFTVKNQQKHITRFNYPVAIHINPLLKIVPNKCTFCSCFLKTRTLFSLSEEKTKSCLKYLRLRSEFRPQKMWQIDTLWFQLSEGFVVSRKKWQNKTTTTKKKRKLGSNLVHFLWGPEVSEVLLVSVPAEFNRTQLKST